MRAALRTRRAGPLMALGLAATVLLFVATGPVGHSAADPRLEEAEERRQDRQEKLDAILSRLHELEATVENSESELASLEATMDGHRQEADASSLRVASHVRASYQYGANDPFWTLLAAEDAAMVTEQTRLLAVLAGRYKTEAEQANAARLQVQATAERFEEMLDELDSRKAELEEAREEAAALLAEAEAMEADVRETIRQEQAEERRRQEAERRRAAMASRGSSGGPSGDIACPVAQPRSYTDTYGAPRSGGRAHRGTDILAPMGTHIYAYEDGTISRMQNSRLGGITLYLQGDSGTTYYYAHVQGYVSGLSPGQRVRAGEHIAFNGDTGNATGIPHLHIEVMPGGGGNVNPYPYVLQACG